MVAFLGLTGVFGVVLWCALSPTPDLVNIQWMPKWLGKWAYANPTFRNFTAFGILAMVFYAAGITGLDPFRGARQYALAFISAVTVSFAAVTVEVAQLWLPGRSSDPDDIAWSIAGALTGAFVAFLAALTRVAKAPSGSPK